MSQFNLLSFTIKDKHTIFNEILKCLHIKVLEKTWYTRKLMQEHNQKLFQYFILDFQWIILYCNVVICLVWIGI